MNCILLLGLVTLAAFVDFGHAELCFPDQWQGFMKWKSLMKEAPFYGEITRHVFSDVKYLRRAWHVSDKHNGKVRDIAFHVATYNRSGKGKTHYYVNLQTKVCRKLVDKAATFDKDCLPADAKNLGKSSLGIAGSCSIAVTDYAYQTGSNTQKVLTVLNTGTDIIIPIHQTTLVGENSRFSDIVYYNFTIGLQDHAVFDVPKQCEEIVDNPVDIPYGMGHL